MVKSQISKLPSPEEIKEFLDKYVIGQDEAKKILSVAVYNHYKRIIYNKNYATETEIEKTNCILLGESGSGKSLLIKTIAKLLGVPYYIQDTTKLTASGYVGSDVEDCVAGLLRACNYDVRAAECGLIALDEADKIAKKAAGPSITRDVSGECVQQSLLKIVEGDLVGVNPEGGRKHPDQPLTYVDTKNILFICLGAFVGLEDIIKRRLGQSKIGFDQNNNDVEITNESNLNEYVTSEDLKEFGFIPEFVGRFPVITSVKKLTVDDLKRILTEPKNAVTKQYKELLAMDTQILNSPMKPLQRLLI